MADRGLCIYVGDDEDCHAPVAARGYCHKHYHRLQKYGDPSVVLHPRKNGQRCTVEGCVAIATGRDWCNKHYQRWYSYGDPEAITSRERQMLDIEQRIQKTCPHCKVLKPADSFHRAKSRADGLKTWCIACCREVGLMRYQSTHPNWRSMDDKKATAPENARRIKREYKKRHPEVASRHDVLRRMAIQENYVEDVNPLVLAERDGWTCQICCTPIDPGLLYLNDVTGRPNDGYRTIDHIIPISRNGEHSYANTRIAHWICNVRRWTGEREKVTA